MKRTCPFCKSDLTKSNIYFCSHCGSALPDNAQLKDYLSKDIGKTDLPDELKKQVKKRQKNPIKLPSLSDIKIVFTGLLVVLGLAVCLYYLVVFIMSEKSERLPVNQPLSNLETTKKTASDKNSLVLDVSLVNGPIAQKNSTDYIIYDADLYGDFNGLQNFEDYFGQLNSGYSLFVKENLGNLSPHFSVFSKSDGDKFNWGFIFFTLDEEMEMKGYGNLVISKIGEAIAMTDSKTVMEEVKSAKEGISKNLSLNPSFVSIRNKIPLEGKVFIMTLNPNGLAALDFILAKTTSNELKSIIEAFKGLNSNYLVVK